MSEWIISVIQALGYPGIAALMLLETVFPPIPSELIMPYAGLNAARGEMSLTGAITAGTVGSALGAVALYWIAKLVGKRRLEGWVERHGVWIGVSPEELGKAEDWFSNHSGWVVLAGRLMPVIRSLISIPAGLCGMTFLPFLLYTTIGSALWVAFLTYLGTILGENYTAIKHWLDPVTWVILAVLIGPFLYRMVRHLVTGDSGGKERAR